MGFSFLLKEVPFNISSKSCLVVVNALTFVWETVSLPFILSDNPTQDGVFLVIGFFFLSALYTYHATLEMYSFMFSCYLTSTLYFSFKKSPEDFF